MTMTPSTLDRTRKVVLLIDYDNLQICASRDTPGRDLQITPVVALAQRYGTVVVSRAYAEWNLSTERLAVYKAGIEPAFAPVLRTENDRAGKSLADTVMVADCMDILWTLQPDVLVLATSDKDLIPLVRVAKQRGAHVVVIGSDLTAIPLREMADEHVTYKQLATEALSRNADFVPGRLAPSATEPVRRVRERSRERERDVKEREKPVSAPAPVGPVATPVAPVSPAVGGDLDATGRRRRRRRGRRGERLEGETTGLERGEEFAEEPEAVDDVSSPTVEAVIEDVADDEGLPLAAEDDQPPLMPRLEAGEVALNGEVDSADVAEPANEAESEAPEQAEAPARKPRPRRVASAAKGRTRTARR